MHEFSDINFSDISVNICRADTILQSNTIIKTYRLHKIIISQANAIKFMLKDPSEAKAYYFKEHTTNTIDLVIDRPDFITLDDMEWFLRMLYMDNYGDGDCIDKQIGERIFALHFLCMFYEFERGRKYCEDFISKYAVNQDYIHDVLKYIDFYMPYESGEKDVIWRRCVQWMKCYFHKCADSIATNVCKRVPISVMKEVITSKDCLIPIKNKYEMITEYIKHQGYIEADQWNIFNDLFSWLEVEKMLRCNEVEVIPLCDTKKKGVSTFFTYVWSNGNESDSLSRVMRERYMEETVNNWSKTHTSASPSQPPPLLHSLLPTIPKFNSITTGIPTITETIHSFFFEGFEWKLTLVMNTHTKEISLNIEYDSKTSMRANTTISLFVIGPSNTKKVELKCALSGFKIKLIKDMRDIINDYTFDIHHHHQGDLLPSSSLSLSTMTTEETTSISRELNFILQIELDNIQTFQYRKYSQ